LPGANEFLIELYIKSSNKEMEGLEEFEELFGLDITDNYYLSESFNNGPINSDNLFEEAEMEHFDSIVPDDISRFLDTEITELKVDEEITIPEDIFNFNLETVSDQSDIYNNQSNAINFMDSLVYNHLDPGIDEECQVKQEHPEMPEVVKQGLSEPWEIVKQELPELPEIEQKCNFSISHPNLDCNVNEVPFVVSLNGNGHVSINENVKNSDNKKRTHQNGVNIVKNFKLEATPVVNHNRDYRKFNPINKADSKGVRSFHFCELCPFKTKEKSIFRMHQSFVHKIEATKPGKKQPSQKTDTFRRSYRPAAPKKYLKKCAPNSLTNEHNTRKSEASPVLGSQISPKFPTIQNDNIFPVDSSKVSCSAFPPGTGYLRSILKCSEGDLFKVTSCKVIRPAPGKPVGIPPIDHDYSLTNTIKVPHKHDQDSNGGSKRDFNVFVCDKCNKQYSRVSSLVRHEATVHKGVRYPCDQCDTKPFVELRNLRNHKESVHEGIRYPCDQCHIKPFKESRQLKKHIEKDHKGGEFWDLLPI